MKKSINIALFVIVIFFTSLETNSQPVAQWIARFNGLLDSTDIANDITVDNSGNSYVTGYSYTLLGLLTGAVTISYDAAGNQRWRAEYDQLLNDEGTAIVMDNTGQYVYVAGYTNGLLNLTLADFVIIKYRASDGQQMWARTYSSSLLTDNRATGITIDNLNNPIITGYSQEFLLLLTPYDYVTIKYDSAGNQQWLRRYNGTGNNEDIPKAVTVDNFNNVIVTGESIGSGSNYDYATIKYSSTGTQQWVQRYNGPGNDEDRAYAIVVDNSDNIIITGGSIGSNSDFDYATVKYNPAGLVQWASRFNGSGNNEDRAYAIVVDNSDNAIVTGFSRSGSNSGSEDYATVKYNTSGAQQWVSLYNGTGNNEDRAYAIVVDNSDNIIVTGSSRSTGSAGSEDYATLEYDQLGTQQWVVKYNGTGNNEDRAYAIVVDNSDNIYITGTSRNGSLLGSEDYLTIKYSSSKLVGTPKFEEGIPSEYKVYQNYPNPFNPATKFKIDVPKFSFVKLVIYDILGNEKEVLINKNMNPGMYEVTWTATDLTSGIYFYRISIGDYSAAGKMMLIK